MLQLVNFSCSQKKKPRWVSWLHHVFILIKVSVFKLFQMLDLPTGCTVQGGQFLLLLEKKNRRWLFWPHHVHTCQSQYFQAMHCIKMLELPTGCRASKWSQGLVSLLCFLVNKQNKTAISCSWPKAYDQGSVKVDGKHAILHWVLGIES